MNYKPDESVLIAYLYGELNEKETEKLEAYFQLHPEELATLRSLGAVRSVMGNVQDKEVIAPPIFMEDERVRPLWRSPFFKMTMGLAASLLFLLVAGKLLAPEISYSKGELRISFGERTEPIAAPSGLSEQQVNELISASLAKHNEKQAATRTDEQKKLMQTLVDFNSKKIDAMTKNVSQASQEQVRAFVANLQEQNLKLMKDYFQLSATDQKKYTEKLLIDFSAYLQEQRKQDLQFVQNKMNYLEINNNQFKQETEQIITSLISNPSKKKSSY